jgi:hypothetical protein
MGERFFLRYRANLKYPRSTPVEWLRYLQNPLRRRVPALRGIGIVVEIAAHANQLRPFGEGEVAAHRWSAHVAVEFGELGAIDEVDTPLPLDARAAVDHFVGMGVGVASRPDVNRAGMCGKVVFKGLCLRLVTEEIEIRGSFGCPVGAVISPGPEGPVGVPRDTFEVAGPDRRFPQHVMGAGHDDVVFRRLDVVFPPFESFGG